MKDPSFVAEYERQATIVEVGAKQMKTGFMTSEFYVTAVVNIIAAVIGILAIRGLVTAEEGNLYVALARGVAVTVAPLVMAWVTNNYIRSRTEVKVANGENFEVIDAETVQDMRDFIELFGDPDSAIEPVSYDSEDDPYDEAYVEAMEGVRNDLD
jgi:hypothetical protein